MRAPTIDLLPRKVPRAFAVAWVVLCVGGGLYFGRLAWQARVEARELDRQNLQLAQRINQLTAEIERRQEQGRKPPPAYLAEAQVLAKMASFPLQGVLKALETTPLTGIKINGIDVRADQGNVDITLEFTDYKSLLAYLAALNEGEPVPRWKLKQAMAGSGRSEGLASVSGSW